MPTCGKCSESFCDHQSINGIVLTRVCERCIVSTELLTKTSAISLGARVEDLDHLDHREPNPYYRNVAPTYLFIADEVKHVAGIAKMAREEREGVRRSKEEIQTRVKRDRQEERDKCLEKRIRTAFSKIKSTAPPTPGLVSGDFCTSATKTPEISITKLSKRVALWRSLHTIASLSHKVYLFRFACTNKLYTSSRDEIEASFEGAHRSLDRVVLSEGHRILKFLTPMERLHASRAVPSMDQELHGLPVSAMGDGMYALCQYAKTQLEKMRSTHPVTRKRMFGKSTSTTWNDVYTFLISKSGHVIPARIGFYGVSRVFDMLCREAIRGTRSGNVYDCFARLGNPSPPYRFLQTLSGKYIENPRLRDFQSVEQVIRIFCDKLMKGVDVPWRFDQLLREMGQMVYHEGKTWAQAADDAARSITSADPVLPGLCVCGNPAATKCVRNRCRTCCRSLHSVVACLRHKN